MNTFFCTIRAYFMLTGHLLTVYFNLLYGVWRISKLTYAPVTIFGGGRLTVDSIYMQQAQQLAHMLAADDIPVLSGGGPGIMQAANCGASIENKKIITTLGIEVKGLIGEIPNTCAGNTLFMRYFFSRKWLLISFSIGFIVFPGGFGTLDELGELLTLIQTKNRTAAPIILIGIAYWKPLIDWIYNSALANNLIAQKDAELFTLTDSIEEAFAIIKSCHKRRQFVIKPNK